MHKCISFVFEVQYSESMVKGKSDWTTMRGKTAPAEEYVRRPKPNKLFVYNIYQKAT
jgi:hypothetical protein